MTSEMADKGRAIDKIIALIPKEQISSMSESGNADEVIATLQKQLSEVSPKALEILAEGDLTPEGWANVQAFAYQLVLDGRFEERLPDSIEKFAELHDLVLPKAFLKWANTAPQDEFLATLQAMGKYQMDGSAPVQVLGVGFIIGGVMVGDAVITIVSLASKASGELVVDNSAEADDKL